MRVYYEIHISRVQRMESANGVHTRTQVSVVRLHEKKEITHIISLDIHWQFWSGQIDKYPENAQKPNCCNIFASC